MDKQELRTKFYNECVDNSLVHTDCVPKVNIHPHELFEWFWKEFKFNQKEAIKELYDLDKSEPVSLPNESSTCDYPMFSITGCKYDDMRSCKGCEHDIEVKEEEPKESVTDIPDNCDKKEAFYCHDESYHMIDRCTQECNDCFVLVKKEEPKEGDVIILEDRYLDCPEGEYKISKDIRRGLLWIEPWVTLNEVIESGIKYHIKK